MSPTALRVQCFICIVDVIKIINLCLQNSGDYVVQKCMRYLDILPEIWGCWMILIARLSPIPIFWLLYFVNLVSLIFTKRRGGGPDPSTLPLDLRMKYIMIDIFYRTVPLYL